MEIKTDTANEATKADISVEFVYSGANRVVSFF